MIHRPKYRLALAFRVSCHNQWAPTMTNSCPSEHCHGTTGAKTSRGAGVLPVDAHRPGFAVRVEPRSRTHANTPVLPAAVPVRFGIYFCLCLMCFLSFTGSNELFNCLVHAGFNTSPEIIIVQVFASIATVVLYL